MSCFINFLLLFPRDSIYYTYIYYIGGAWTGEATNIDGIWEYGIVWGAWGIRGMAHAYFPDHAEQYTFVFYVFVLLVLTDFEIVCTARNVFSCDILAQGVSQDVTDNFSPATLPEFWEKGEKSKKRKF